MSNYSGVKICESCNDERDDTYMRNEFNDVMLCESCYNKKCEEIIRVYRKIQQNK